MKLVSIKNNLIELVLIIGLLAGIIWTISIGFSGENQPKLLTIWTLMLALITGIYVMTFPLKLDSRHERKIVVYTHLVKGTQANCVDDFGCNRPANQK